MKTEKVPLGYRPLEKNEGVAKIADELCHCGCLKSNHAGMDGHGSCICCDCARFTWKMFLAKVPSELKAMKKPLHSKTVSAMLEMTSKEE